MTEIVIPSALRIARSSFKYIDQTGVSRGVFSGAIQSTAYGGDRVGASLDFTPAGGASTADRSLRAQIKAVLMAMRGKQNRIFAEDNSTTRRGSFSAPELFANYDFSGGVASWTGINSNLSAADGLLKMSVSGAGANPLVRQAVSLTQYAPHAIRSVIYPGRTFIEGAMSFGASIEDGTNSGTSFATSGGYRVGSIVAASAASTQQLAAIVQSSSGYRAGDSVVLAFTSLSRCLLADGGGNYLLRSDETDNAAWTKTRCSYTGTALAPDQTSTGDTITEDSSNNSHFVTQGSLTVPAAAADFAFTVCVRSNGRNFVNISIDEATGGTTVSQYFNLGTGAVGTTGATGANWANRRAFITDLGNAWYACTIVARKTNAATSLSGTIAIATADGTGSYLGNGSSGVALWRATLTQSGVPSRLTATTTVAIAATSQPGAGLHVKGLPASTSGLLLLGDWVEIDGQLKMVIASLDSDAAGLGYLQFSPPLRRAVSDNTPIIVNRPMGRFILAGDAMWNNVPGVFSDASVELEEAWS